MDDADPMFGNTIHLLFTALALSQQLLYGAVLGVVQGISEWLPISSKTQVLIASHYLLGFTIAQAYTFGLFMEIGSVIAAIIYFRKELLSLVQVLLGSRDGPKTQLFAYVLVTTIVTGLIGAPLYWIAKSITGGLAIGIPMLLIGGVLILDSLVIWHSRRRRNEGRGVKKLADLGVRDYLVLGVVQGVSALPGVSRSGITTSAMLLMNIEPDEAFRLSFLVGIFAAIGAACLTLLVSHADVLASLAALGAAGTVTAIIVSALVSIFLIDFLIRVAGKSKIVYLTAALGIIAILGGVIYLALGAGLS